MDLGNGSVSNALSAAQASCGDVQQLRIQPDMWSLGHCMLGCESASLRVETPSGQVLRPPLQFSSGRFVAQCQLLEAGWHAVHGMVDGEPVPGSPMTVEMVAGRINPTLCSVVGLRDVNQKVRVELLRASLRRMGYDAGHHLAYWSLTRRGLTVSVSCLMPVAGRGAIPSEGGCARRLR